MTGTKSTLTDEQRIRRVIVVVMGILAHYDFHTSDRDWAILCQHYAKEQSDFFHLTADQGKEVFNRIVACFDLKLM